MSSSHKPRCEHGDLVAPYALAALDPAATQSMQAHLPTCAACRQEYAALGPVTSALAAWRAQILPRTTPLWERLTARIADRPQKQAASSPAASSSRAHEWPEPCWKEVASGISCKLLSVDTEMDRVSMLVRLVPGAEYPPHRHASVEELYLLEGELWIDDRKLCPGDYNRAEPDTSDQRVWSATGCMCLLMTSPSDQLA